MKKNQVKILVFQHIPAYTNKKGNLVPEFNNEVEFTSDTIQVITVENVANFAMCSLKKYMSIKRLQGKTGFKMSKDIQITVTVNQKSETTEMKFSLNEERLRRTFEKAPKLLAAVFAPAPGVGGLTTQKALNYIFNEGKLVLAAAKSPLKLVDAVQEVQAEEVPAIPE